MKFFIETDLVKAQHKYLKREGSKGNYKYFYQMPDGSISAPDDKQESGKKEHLQRLLAGRMRNIHTQTNKQIAEEVGVPQKKVSDKDWGMKRPGQNLHNEHNESHLHEANIEVTHGSYQGHVDASQVEHDSGARSARSGSNETSGSGRPATPSSSSAGPTPTNASETSRPRTATRTATAQASSPASSQQPNQTQENAGKTAEQKRAAAIKEKRQKLKELFGVELGNRSATNETVAPTPSVNYGPITTPPAQTDADRRAAKEQTIRDNVARANEQLAQARRSTERAQEAAIQATQPTTPAANELRATVNDPVLDRDEAELASMITEQNAGKNPYMNKAKDIFERISHNIKPERRAIVGHLFQALEYLKIEDRPLNNSNIIEEYNRISGRRVREIGPISEEFEKATFHTLDEVMTNPKINPEVERMKRGYAAKQFARAKPFLKDSWLQGNAGAPPPHPTFGDFKSWTEHGGVKPSWAGTTRLAVPKEIYDAAFKGADGKPQYPGPKVPIHMMPVWNYIAKKTDRENQGRDVKTSPYANTKDATKNSDSKTGWNLDMGDQAKFQEGVLTAAMRKYIQFRGGPNQLTDIPSSKLAKENLTHADIFKSEDVDPYQVMNTKIIDMVGLMPFVKDEIKEHKSKIVKKSFVLVINKNEKTDLQKSLEAEELKKSELISKIKAIKAARQFVISQDK